MSLILDALKKSEAQRQRGQIPTLATPSMRPSGVYEEKSASKKWLWLSIVLIALMLGMAGMWWKQTQKTMAPLPTPTAVMPAAVTPTAVTPTAPITTSSTVTFPDKKIAEKKDAPSTKKVDADAASVKPAAETAPSDSKKTAAPANTTAFTDPPKQANNETPTSSSPVIETSFAPYLSTMASDLRRQLPAMKLSMHVYTNEPSKRFAIIDGQRVNEGSSIGNAIVERINTEGVIVSVQGQSYLVPRP
jgi:general secretion pathway protein B